jgi:hypothetical protein
LEFEIVIRGRLPLMDIHGAERLMAAFLNQVRAIGLGFTMDLDLPMTALVAIKTDAAYESPWWVIRGPEEESSMNYLFTTYRFFVSRWDRIKQAARLVFGLGQELSQELRQVEKPEGEPEQ